MESSETIEKLEDLLSFGPRTLIRKSVWKRMLRECRAYMKSKKEVMMALLGYFRDDVLIVVSYSVLQGRAGPDYVEYSTADLKNIESQFGEDGLVVGGLIHTHPNASVEASEEDRKCWTAAIFDFDHPIYFFILEPSTLKIACYSTPLDEWMKIRDAIKPVELTMKEGPALEG